MEASPPDLRDIVRRLGGDLYLGGRAALVPSPGHSRKDRGLSLRLKGDPPRLLWHSHNGAAASAVWKHLGLEVGQVRQETPAEHRKREAEERAERQRKLAFCADLWRETVDAEGTLAERYLRGRGLTLPIPKALRFHPAASLSYPWTQPAGDRFPSPPRPAMVAIVTASDGKSAAGLHVTALDPDTGGKARMRQARRMFGELRGAVVQLGPLPTDDALGVAEGIETALAYRQLKGLPTWAALSTSGLRAFTVPAGVTRLIIAADSDDAPQREGMAAARVCAERAVRRCDVAIDAAPDGQDWADVLKGGAQ